MLQLHLEAILDPLVPRARLVDALTKGVADVMADLNKPGERASPIYLTGTGYDFTEFGVEIAKRTPSELAGVACVWTERCDLPFDDSVFAIPQQYIEPVVGREAPGLVLAASIIADKMEVLTVLTRVMGKVKPRSLTIAYALINQDVKAELRSFLEGFFDNDSLRFTGDTLDLDLQQTRSTVASRLDDRPVKTVPIWSTWLFERRFGPRPKPGLDDSPAGPTMK